jgi:hypothetical protein
MHDPPTGPESAPLLEPEPLLELPAPEELFTATHIPPKHIPVESQAVPLQHGSPTAPQLVEPLEPPSW